MLSNDSISFYKKQNGSHILCTYTYICVRAHIPRFLYSFICPQTISIPWQFVNNGAMNMGTELPLWDDFVSCEIYTGMGLLNHMVFLFLTEKPPYCFP